MESEMLEKMVMTTKKVFLQRTENFDKNKQSFCPFLNKSKRETIFACSANK